MKHRQAVIFWNDVAKGELLQVIPDTHHNQGYEVHKDTYTPSVCEHYELPSLRINDSRKEERKRIATFLRSLADGIEND
ncbi:hypothetical protein VPHK37_0024 [Vibrio phage K37]